MKLAAIALKLFVSAVCAFWAGGCGAPRTVPATPPAAASKPPSPARPGEIAHEPSTPHSLGFRWAIMGDDNGNAKIDVAYRLSRNSEWRIGYALFRVHPKHASPDNRVSGGVLFAGSIVDLEPDTAYEVRLALVDPDGGEETRVVSARTTREPVAPEGLRVRHVVPEAEGARRGAGTREDPFVGFAAALAAAEPGDLLALGSGTYRGAPFRVARSGAERQPIVIRGPEQGEAIIDGGGAALLIDAVGVYDVWFERLTLRNARTLLQADLANRLVVRGNRFELTRLGFSARGATYAESRGFFVTDNVFAGTTVWPRSRGIESVLAVIITGSGHVVAYNAMRNVADGIHNGNVGRLSASDFHNNDIEIATDDGIEGDYVDTNVRVYRNHITNAFAGISAQPSHGGPLYVFRNLILNTQYSPFKLHNDTAGVLLFHNTSVRADIPFLIQPGGETVNDVVSRNNLFVGTRAPAQQSTGNMIRCDFDADGYAWDSWGEFAKWNGRTYSSPGEAQNGGRIYVRHGAASVRPRPLFASELAPPRDFRKALPAAANDLRLRPDAGAVDRGIPLPNFNDGYAGSAPDLGCCELGAPLPHFGPREPAR